jgi:ribosomal protein S18 acetylase RimI-like enzyme
MPAAENETGPTIRRYRQADRDAVYDICVRTAEAGGDARGRYLSDDLMPDLFAGPYLFLEPELAFVLDDGRRPVGYVLGTADTARFARAYRERWIPRLAGRYPVPPDPPVTADDQLLTLHYHPERLIFPALASFPAHLHIDLLPGFQGAGHGRRLMETFFGAARRAGAAGVHLTVMAANDKALGFYRHLGFRPIEAGQEPAVVYLGYPL